MFRKILIRLIVLGTLAFALFLLLASVQTTPSAESDCTESGMKSASPPQGDFILETIVGSVLIGIK